MPKTKKTEAEGNVALGATNPSGKLSVQPEKKMEKGAMDALLAKVEELERKDAEKDKTIKMLYEVADRGRVMNYESTRSDKKSFKVKLSIYGGGYIVGWRTVKDELTKHPITGAVVGETQEYELLILGKDGTTTKTSVNSYPAFSNARYNERVECEVVNKTEDFAGNTTFTLLLPDGRQVQIASQFVN